MSGAGSGGAAGLHHEEGQEGAESSPHHSNDEAADPDQDRRRGIGVVLGEELLGEIAGVAVAGRHGRGFLLIDL